MDRILKQIKDILMLHKNALRTLVLSIVASASFNQAFPEEDSSKKNENAPASSKTPDTTKEQSTEKKEGESATEKSESNLPDDKTVVAEIEGKKITLGELKTFLLSYAEGMPTEILDALLTKNFDKILKTFINSKVAELQSEKEGLAKNEEVQKKIKRLTDNLLEKLVIKKAIEVYANDEKLLKHLYELDLPDLKKAVSGIQKCNLTLIVSKTEKEAKEILKTIKGMSLKDIEKKYPMTQEDNASPYGTIRLGFIDLHPSYQKTLPDFPLEELKKAASGTTIQKVFSSSPNKWIIYRVEDKEAKKVPTFEEYKPELQQKYVQLFEWKAREAAREKFKVVLYDLNGKVIKDSDSKATESKIIERIQKAWRDQALGTSNKAEDATDDE